jgi:hypothetical protein
MNILRRTILPVILATIWIIISEFIRNEYLLKSYWTKHNKELGLVFPSQPINGAIWGLWSLLFATCIFILSKRFSFIQAAIISWFAGFVLMWVVLGNLGILPDGLLFAAIPLSLFETVVALFIVKKLS